MPLTDLASYQGQQEITAAINGLGSLENALRAESAANRADLSATVASTKATQAATSEATALSYKNAAQTSADNAASSYAQADTVATALTDIYNDAIDQGTIVAPAVDATLSVSGAAADAKMTGWIRRDTKRLNNNSVYTELDLREYTTSDHYISTGGVWAYSPPNIALIVPAEEFGISTIFKAVTQPVVYAFLTNNTTTLGETPSYCDGTQLSAVTIGNERTVTMPNDCQYVYIFLADSIYDDIEVDVQTYVNTLVTLKTESEAEIADVINSIAPNLQADCFGDYMSVDDGLQTSKWQCTHHDNFARADSADGLGANHTGMEYTAMGNTNIKVGIDDEYACITQGDSDAAASSYRIDYITIGSFPYRVDVKTEIDFRQYVVVDITDNDFCRIEVIQTANVGNIKLTKNKSANEENVYYSSARPFGTISIIVTKTELVFYDDGIYLGKYARKNTSANAGLYWRNGSIANEKVKMFNAFKLSRYKEVPLGTVVQRTGNFGILYAFTGNANGITLANSPVIYADKSVKFLVTHDDTLVSNSYHSELEINNNTTNFVNANLDSRVYDFYVYFPEGYVPDYVGELFFQMHPITNNALDPSVSLRVLTGNVITLDVRGSEYSDVTNGNRHGLTTEQIPLFTLETEKWYHFTVFIREGYTLNQAPLTVVALDGKVIAKSTKVNTYNLVGGSRMQFGIYKYGWADGQPTPSVVTSRTLYIENMRMWA